MNNYRIVKNTDWKEVEINGEMTEIPVDWEVKKIKDVAKIIPGQSPEMNYINEKDGIDFHQGNTLFSSKFIKPSIKKIQREKAKKIAPANSILMSVRAPVGDINVTNSDIAIGRGLTALVPFNTKEYLLNILRLNKEKIAGLGSGSTFEGIKISEFSEFQFMFSTEQSSIASILSAQESIIQDIESLISKYESRFQYLSEELLSGKLRVKEVDGKTVFYKNPEDNWKEVEVNGEMKEIPKDWTYSNPKMLGFNIKTGKKDANAAKKNGIYPFFTCSSSEVFRIDSYTFDTEALLISGNGSTLGEVRYYKGRFDAYQRTYVIDNIKNIFYYDLYFKKYFKNSLNIVGGSIPFIKLGDIEYFDILIPNDYEKSIIVSVLNHQIELITKQKDLCNKEENKFNFLLDYFLSGKVLIKE